MKRIEKDVGCRMSDVGGGGGDVEGEDCRWMLREGIGKAEEEGEERVM